MKFNLKKIAIVAGAFGAVVGFMSGSPSPAQGYFTRVNGSVCRPMWPLQAHRYEVSDGEAYLSTNTLNASAKVGCPIPDTTGMPKSSITTLKVYVYDNHPLTDAPHQITARTCAFNAADRTGGSCGSTVTSSGAGKQVLTPSISELNTAGETAYVYVLLPPTSGEIGSRVEQLYFGS